MWREVLLFEALRFEFGEPEREGTVSKMEIIHGSSGINVGRQVGVDNLDAILFESNESATDSAISILETTAADGKTNRAKCYSLAVGYRKLIGAVPFLEFTNSKRSIQSDSEDCPAVHSCCSRLSG